MTHFLYIGEVSKTVGGHFFLAGEFFNGSGRGVQNRVFPNFSLMRITLPNPLSCTSMYIPPI